LGGAVDARFRKIAKAFDLDNSNDDSGDEDAMDSSPAGDDLRCMKPPAPLRMVLTLQHSGYQTIQ
jgi:hypothetical protein